MGDFFDKKRVLWAGMMIFIFASFLAMNCLTPYVADDYGNLPPFVPDGIKRDQSIGDIVAPVIQFYRSWGGRVIASVLTAFFAHSPAFVFDLLNTMAYFCVTGLMYLICKGNSKHSPVLYIGIHILLWFFVPDYGQVMFWMCGSANYLWTSLPILAMIYFYRRYACSMGKTMNNPAWGVLLFLIGAIAGCGMENSSAGMLVVITLYLFYFHFSMKIKIRFPILCGYVGSITGFCVLLFAPGNKVRIQASEQLSLLFKFFVINYYWVCFIGVPCVLFVVLYLINKKTEGIDAVHSLRQAIVFAAAAVASAYCMLAAPTSPERTWFIVCVYAVCANGILFEQLEAKITKTAKTALGIAAAGIFIVMSVLMADTMICSYEITVQTRQREIYIVEQKEKGNFDITVPVITHKYPLRSQHDALAGLSDIKEDPSFWMNQVLADYYGVRTITGKVSE